MNTYSMNTYSMKRFIILSSMVVLLGVGLFACGDESDNGDRAATREPIQFRCLGQGSTAGDGNIVSDGGRFDLSPPYSLERATAGVTLSMFPPVTESLENLDFQVNFTSRGHPPTECSAGGGGVGSLFGEHVRVRLGAREGLGVGFSEADLVDLVEFLRTSPGAGDCADVTQPGDLSIDSVVLFQPRGDLVGIDGLAIGRTATTFPTAATSPPSCLQP